MLGVLARKRRPLLLALTLACGACGLTAVGTSVTNERTDSTDASTADADSPDSRTDAPVVPKTDGVPPLVVRLDINGPTHVGVEYEGTWTAAPVPDGGCGPSAYTAEAPLSNTKDAPLFAGEAYGSPLVCAVGEGLAPGMYLGAGLPRRRWCRVARLRRAPRREEGPLELRRVRRQRWLHGEHDERRGDAHRAVVRHRDRRWKARHRDARDGGQREALGPRAVRSALTGALASRDGLRQSPISAVHAGDDQA